MINLVVFEGNLGRDPELRTVGKAGTSVCNFSVAHNAVYYTGEGSSREKKEKTTWAECTAWAKNAELICDSFAKGDRITVEGDLETEEWEDAEGNKRSRMKIRINKFHFHPKKNGAPASQTDDFEDAEEETETPPPKKTKAKAKTAAAVDSDEEIPF